jgi:hypothetical protein
VKLHVDRTDIERVGVDTETEFKIKTTAKAFDILSSGLYTDNILAVVRELSCNAYDAHVAAGKKDVPFEIHLPNRLEPFFSVKDFGTGLSDEQVMTLYTTYFDSTKTESNDFIGALGLGSKSPFSYVKAFEVISRYNSVRRVYSVFINEDGVPTIARIGKPMATDEHNGIEVKMTVEPDDFYRFRDKTATALRWFPVKPKVIGDANFRFDQPPATEMQGDGWFIYKDHGGGRMHAVQGNVEYRVDIHQIEGIDDSVRAFLKTVNVIGFFDIGDLEVAASREEIRYDKRTKEALAKKVDSIHRAALKSIEDKADVLLSGGLWAAIIELDKLSASMFRTSAELRSFVNKSNHPVLKAYAESQGRVKLISHHAHDVYVYSWARYGKNLKREKMSGGPSPRSDIAVFKNDVSVGGIGRLTQWMNDNGKRHAIVIVERKDPIRYEKVEDNDGNVDMIKHSMSKKEVAAEYKALVEGFGNPSVKLISRDTAPTRREAKERMSAIFKYGTYYRNAYRPDTVRWDRVEDIDMSAGGLYFLLERGRTIRWNDKKIDWSAHMVMGNIEMLTDVINDHLGLEYNATEHVFGVGAGDIKKFVKHDKWFNLFDLFDSAIPRYADAAAAKDRWEKTPNLHDLKRAITSKAFMKHVSTLNAKSPFRQVVNVLHQAYNEMNNLHLPHTSTVREFDYAYGRRTITAVDVEGHIDDNALQQYPMLSFVDSFVSSSYNRINLDILFDYIRTIDGSN